MSKDVYFLVPAHAAPKIVQFTNDYTIWSAERPATIEATEGDNSIIVMYVDDSDDTEELANSIQELTDYIEDICNLMNIKQGS